MSDHDRRESFADETTTGRFRVQARGIRRALIAAKVDGQDYEWWAQFKKDLLPGVPEPKSNVVLPLIERDARAHDRLADGLVAQSHATVVIIDFSEDIASLVRGLYERVGIPAEVDPFEVLARRELDPASTEAILRYVRDVAIERSAVGRVEWLFNEALSAAPVILSDEAEELVDRDRVRSLNANQQRELLARFSIAFGEALDPRRRADILTRRVEEDMRYFESGHFAYVALEETVAVNQTFDKGSEPAFEMIAEAHRKVVETLDQAFYRQFERRAGNVREDDSRNLLGIQVADIAAAVASREYELTQGTVRNKAECVRAIFGRVMLNDEWL